MRGINPRFSCDHHHHRAPLQDLITDLYRIPGFLTCIRKALESGAIQDASSIGWFALSVASKVGSVALPRS